MQQQLHINYYVQCRELEFHSFIQILIFSSQIFEMPYRLC